MVGLAAALRAGALTADAVALEARKAADELDETGHATKPSPTSMPAVASVVASLTGRRLAQLPPDTRPLPSVAAYDQLLRHHRNRYHRDSSTAEEGTTTS